MMSTNGLQLVLLIAVILLNCFHTSHGLSLAAGSQRGDGRKLFGGYKITPKFCSSSKLSKADAKVQGPAICMFNHECTQRKGEVIGACMDGFLFGTCCLLSGEIETSLANMKTNQTSQLSNILEDLVTRGPGIVVSSKPQVVNNQFYGTDTSLYDDEEHEISNEAVFVSSPSPSSYADRISSYHPTYASHPTNYHYSTSQTFATELPNYIQSSPAYSEESENFIQFSKDPYDHSDISHHPADSEVLDEENSIVSSSSGGYPTTLSHSFYTETRTEPSADKNKFSKPIFKPKPTQHTIISTEKYVLVHTVTNDNKQSEAISSANQQPTKKPASSTNDSIQSILLMLNDSNSSNGNNKGPEYSHVDSTTPTSEGGYPSTSMIDYDKYGSSSYYITTKNPQRKTSVKVPSTSYIYSPNPTRRPTTSKSTASPKTTTTRSVNRIKVSTKSPQQQKLTTLNVPSTSYIYSPNPITRRPSTKAPTPTASPTKAPLKTSTANKNTLSEKNTSSKPTIIINQSNNDVEGNYVVISGGGVTKLPSPTVHITPKPITNLLTSSTINQIQTKKPPNKISSTTERPSAFFSVSTTPGPFISSSIYYPPSVSNADFNNEGYFAVVTHRPGVSSTAIYAVSPGLLHTVGEDTPIIQNEELSNFPPVRNPNLNMTAPQPVMDESDISTPSFVEDAQLSNKIDLLVNKLIESMQPNLGDLVDIVYEKKNVSTVEGAINGSKKNGTSSAKPAKVTTSKPPPKATTGRPSSTTKKTPAKATTTTAATTKKTTTKKPTARPAVTSTTTKRPKVTSSVGTTKRPVTRRTTTTTTVAPLEDEDLPVEEEEGEEGESETGEETVEEGEESNVIDESEAESQPAQESGRIQCGTRPQYKKGRIVGGTAASFVQQFINVVKGEFPWQVLVRESTWLGLFTKNKCGGVLISNSFVITAAHCQPGFLASLVAVFGEYDISGDLETKRSVSKNIKRVIVHRQYDAATFENDLAILELESPVRYDSHIVPVCMPPDGADYTGKVATVSGWGRLKYGGGVPSVLQEVQVPIIENNICQDMFEHAGHKKKILSSFLCAGYANGQKDSCEGDSGGPLVIQRSDGRYQLIGTVSHGIKCASPYLPGVYMRTNFYKPWIKSITGIK